MSTEAEEREACIQLGVASQGGGKTYYTMHMVRDYVRDKIYNKVHGRKSLILDTNGEYTDEQLRKNDITDFKIPKISVGDIAKFASKDHPIECRRIDAKSLLPSEKLEIMEYCINTFVNGLLILEDPNTYVLSMTHMQDIIGRIVSVRHRGLDVLMNFQRLRAIEPVILSNSRWIRLHYQIDNTDDVKGKLSNPQLFKIAQLMINARYNAGDKRFYVFINQLGNKMEGNFTDQEFETACRYYLSINKKLLNEYMRMHGVDQESAFSGKTEEFKSQYL